MTNSEHPESGSFPPQNPPGQPERDDKVQAFLRAQMELPPGRPRRNLLALIIDHNPLYLLSVLCMLFGCYLLNDALDLRPDNLGKLLLLLATLNLYEFLLIGLAIFLLGRGRAPRDGRMLILLEVLFLADLTFLNAETILTDHFWGSVINLVVLGLAVGKIGLMFRALKVQLGAGRWLFMGLQLLVLYGMPWVFLPLDAESNVPQLRVFGWWWVIAFLPVLFDGASRLWPTGMRLETREVGTTAGRTIAQFYLIVSFLSLVGHLGLNHTVFHVPFFGADLAPLLLGLAVAVGRMRPTKFVPASQFKAIQVGLILVALSMSRADSVLMQWHVFGHDLAPSKVVLVGAYLTLGYCFWLQYLHYLVGAGLAVGLVYGFGPSVDTMQKASSTGYSRITDLIKNLIPSTSKGWGILAVVASFILLGAGAALSVLKPKPKEGEPVEPKESEHLGL